MTKSPATIPFDDGKAPDAMRTIGEVAAGFGIKQHILRYWEQQFPMLRPLKRSGGRRLYRPEDVALLGRIHELINQQGYTLKGARQVIENGASGEVAVAPLTGPSGAIGDGQGTAPDSSAGANVNADTVVTLKSIRARLSKALSAA